MSVAVVAGPVANKPRNGGNAWVPYAYVSGLRRLGFDAFLLEQLDTSTCIDARGAPARFRDSTNLAYFAEVARCLGEPGHSVVICGRDAWGVSPETVPDVLAEADLLFNISGHLTGWLRDLPGRSAYIDLDPGYTQFWNTAGVVHGSRLDGHDVYFTVGQNVGQSECAIPTCGLEWRPALPPSTVEEPPEALGDPGRFTTVGSWRGSFGRIEAGGTTYGLKAHEFRRFAGLPRDVPGVIFEVALDIDPADHKDRRALEENGWRLIDPLAVAGEPAAYRHYIRNSWAEFSAAQGIYVETKSGWFSDRSVRYLASGKPVLVQDTGFGRTLPVGEGLLAFRTLDEAAAGVREIERDYDGHAKAARALAEEYFDSDRILGRMLEEVGVSP